MVGEAPGDLRKEQAPESLDVLRKTHISYVLGLAHGNEAMAARFLEITPGELRRLMRALDIPKPANEGDVL